MKTILLTISHAVNVRDILRGGVLQVLRASGHRIVILSPGHADPAFRAEFAGDNVVVEPLPPLTRSRLQRRLDMLRLTLFPELSDSVRLQTAPTRRRRPWNRVARAALFGVKRLLGRRRTRAVLQWLHMTLFPDRDHADLFARYRPDLVVLTEVIFPKATDLGVLKRARRERVPTLWLVRSWDNLSFNGIMPVPVDRMAVWNDLMREEALTLHDMPADRVFVAGTPHFDVFADLDAIPSREDFFRRIGADPARRLITYAMAPLTRADAEFEVAVIEHLCATAREGGFGVPCQVLARAYPLRAFRVHERLTTLPDLIVDVPGRDSAVFTDRDISVDDQRHLAATLRYSGVIVNVASTIMIEAAVCGTPSICTAFELPPGRPYLESHLRYFDWTHHQKLRATGGVRLARSLEDLVAQIRVLLANPAVAEEGRRRLVSSFCHQLDGRAGERVGSFILGCLGAPEPARQAVGAAILVPGAERPA